MEPVGFAAADVEKFLQSASSRKTKATCSHRCRGRKAAAAKFSPILCRNAEWSAADASETLKWWHFTCLFTFCAALLGPLQFQALSVLLPDAVSAGAVRTVVTAHLMSALLHPNWQHNKPLVSARQRSPICPRPTGCEEGLCRAVCCLCGNKKTLGGFITAREAVGPGFSPYRISNVSAEWGKDGEIRWEIQLCEGFLQFKQLVVQWAAWGPLRRQTFKC